jgi:hypothetical protein
VLHEQRGGDVPASLELVRLTHLLPAAIAVSVPAAKHLAGGRECLVRAPQLRQLTRLPMAGLERNQLLTRGRVLRVALEDLLPQLERITVTPELPEDPRLVAERNRHPPDRDRISRAAVLA